MAAEISIFPDVCYKGHAVSDSKVEICRAD